MISDIDRLFEQQLQVWPLLASGTQGLARAITRTVRINWFDVHIRHIPHRVVSTTAAVDRESIERRPCFLCANNMPREQVGVKFDENYTIYCNPYPIVRNHLTIVHREHRPQRFSGQLEALMDLAQSLPGYFVIYNGPECGASAPDHLHFQAGSRDLFPIETDAKEISGTLIPDYARHVLLFRSADRTRLVHQLEHAIDLLKLVTGHAEEPL